MNVYQVSNSDREKLEFRMNKEQLVVTMVDYDRSLQMKFNLTEAEELARILYNMGIGPVKADING